MPEYRGLPINQEALRLSLKNPEPFEAETILMPLLESPRDASGNKVEPEGLSFMTNAFYRLRVDDSRHAQVITGVMFFEHQLDVQKTRLLLRDRMSPFQRMRSIITCDADVAAASAAAAASVSATAMAPPSATRMTRSSSMQTASAAALANPQQKRGGKEKFYWKEVPVDFAYHVVEESLPDPADEATIYDHLGRSFAFEMDPYRPRWRFYIFNNYKGVQGKSVLMSRVSHEIADGNTLVQLTLSLFEKIPSTSSSTETALDKKADLPVAATAPPSLRQRPYTPLRRALRWWGRITDPFLYIKLINLYFISTIKGFFELLFKDSLTAFKVQTVDQMQPERLVGFSKSWPLSVIQSIRPVVEGTMNDVLTAAVAGGLRRYLVRRQDKTIAGNNVQCRALLPFNLRRQAKWDLAKNPHLFGNKFTLLPLTLPMNVEHPLTLLREAKRLCDELKEGTEATIVVGMNKLAATLLPSKLYVWFTHFALDQTTMLFTNVMGPREAVALGGVKLTEICVFVPSPFGICISVLSYNGNVKVGMLTDPSLDANPKEIASCFDEQMQILKDYAEAYAKTPKDPRIPRRYPTVPRRAVSQLLVFLGSVLLLVPKRWALWGIPASHLFYASIVYKLWRQSPAQIM